MNGAMGCTREGTSSLGGHSRTTFAKLTVLKAMLVLSTKLYSFNLSYKASLAAHKRDGEDSLFSFLMGILFAASALTAWAWLLA